MTIYQIQDLVIVSFGLIIFFIIGFIIFSSLYIAFIMLMILIIGFQRQVVRYL